MKHTTPHFIALAVLAIGLPWFFLLADEDHRLLPSLFIVVGAVAVLALDYFGPAALPDPLAAQDPEPWKRPPAANAAEAQAYQAWVAHAGHHRRSSGAERSDDARGTGVLAAPGGQRCTASHERGRGSAGAHARLRHALRSGSRADSGCTVDASSPGSPCTAPERGRRA